MEREVLVDLRTDALHDQGNSSHRVPGYFRGHLGNRQYSFRNNFMARPLKHHQLRRYIKDIDAMAFDNPNSNQKKAPSISNLKELNDCMD